MHLVNQKSTLVTAIAFLALMTIFAEPSAAYDTKTSRKTVHFGEKIQIQTMYSIRVRNCDSDDIPPRPVVMSQPTLGILSYRSGKTAPYQCPEIEINANFADYTAGSEPGIDRFKIHWPRHGGKGVFVRHYVITVTP